MEYTKVQLLLSEEVSALTSVEETYIPASGKSLVVSDFMGSVQSQDGIVLLIWKYGEADEQIIWTLPESSDALSFEFTPPEEEVNGTNKIALIIENNNLSSQYMSGCVVLEMENV